MKLSQKEKEIITRRREELKSPVDKTRLRELFIRPVRIKRLKDKLIFVEFENNERRLYNCHSLIEKDKRFSDLSDEDYFKTVHIDELGLVCWDEYTFIDPESLYCESISKEWFDLV